MDDKLKRLIKKEVRTFLQPTIPNTPVTHVGVHVQQIQPQFNLVVNPTLVNQHLGWYNLLHH